MMTKPGITELDKYVDSRYTLVSMVAKRARMIGTQRSRDEENGITVISDEKPVTQAVNEITDGTVGYVRSEAIQRARVYEQEKFEAISNLEKDAIEASSKSE
ncbi:MAG: DNA-directed RNA polymerase subunit omega [Clostridia bacterium]|nr:DNA-directed RNA polymerase subunit omega [Clostridia bacterium]